MLDDFLFRAFLAGAGLAHVAGPLGCFVIWRRMAYFGDSLAHSALLGVTLGFLLNIDLQLGVLATCVAVALTVAALHQQQRLPTDTLLGILAHSGLALGLVALSFMSDLRVDLLGYLFGDVLAVGTGDILWIWLGGLAVLGVIVLTWRPLLLATLHEELARAEGVPVLAMRLTLMLTLAITIAVAMKIVGILLVTSMLILPAAAARRFARTPEEMAVLAALFGVLAVGGGLWGSLSYDTPSGPSIVVAALLCFVAALVLGGLVQRR
ncbi:metal ABC transporter permease [Aquibaculum arenosum]|uniref:High-affinity zinc uptake system membrane protein ZnuB n=1 Tax=Aquibaculum arenosum TaxID=3032591 RepID=A0ABT5YJT2_9PROT|nr:metal ABC transporter permease [Fodinicurvata sp. CAU 1616]MDF2095182.1 metal ABC transporter permease [Fodinicurvata sp. CAU 1616]